MRIHHKNGCWFLQPLHCSYTCTCVGTANPCCMDWPKNWKFSHFKFRKCTILCFAKSNFDQGLKNNQTKMYFCELSIICTEDVLFEALEGYLDAEPAVWHQCLCDKGDNNVDGRLTWLLKMYIWRPCISIWIFFSICICQCYGRL